MGVRFGRTVRATVSLLFGLVLWTPTAGAVVVARTHRLNGPAGSRSLPSIA